jgi:DNA-binding CsgD family transcriptional regulator/endogenous inhibitor of DNA gyrase (YacG/DUF329 family)
MLKNFTSVYALHGFYVLYRLEGLIYFPFRMEDIMTITQKEQIRQMRGGGESYGAIADTLSLPKDTVKSYCRRNLNAQSENPSDTCPQCGVTLVQLPHKRQKKYCSGKCRMEWWNTHAETVNRKAVYTFTCEVCGKSFTAYGNSKRKYCSRACFGISRRAHDE